MAKANNVPSSRPPQFRPAGQAMLGVNNVISRQMSHLPQPGQHLSHSGQALYTSQAAPMTYQPAKPKSSAPILSQQQSVFPGGYSPTTGGPMPPPSYIYQPSSAPPPVVQSPDRALDQSIPLVTSQMQHWHQPASSAATLPLANSADPSSSDWQVHTCTNGKRYYHNKKTRQSSWGKPVELMTPLEVTQFTNAQVKSAESSLSNWQENTSTDGKKYYYNKKTRQSNWVKPAELMTPLERAEASTEWIGFSTSEGRKYYYNRVTKESTWTIPDKLKIAHEIAEKVSNQLPDREPETTAGAAVCAEPSSGPANQSSSVVVVIASRIHNASANSVPPEATLSCHVDNNSSFSDFGIQNDVPSIPKVAPPIASTEVPSVESDSGTSSHTYIQDGASAEDLQERDKAAEEHREHIADYRVLLESCDFIKARTRWRKVQDRLEDDERCSRLEIIDQLDIFEEYIQDLEKEEEEQKRLQQQQARRQERKKRDDFRKMLEEHVADGTLTAKTRWPLYCEQVKSSPTYLGVASNTTGSTPKDLFEDVMEDLEEQYEADKSQIKEAIESGKLPMMASWTLEEFQTAIIAIGSFQGISEINMKLIYAKLIIRLREKEVNEAKRRERLGGRFSDLLYSIMEISASSTWDNSKPLFEDSHEYRNLKSETYARDLFEKRVFHLKERQKEKERLREEEKAKKEREHEEKERKRECEEKERKKETMKEKEKERKEKERREKERKEREREKERERDKGNDWSRRAGVHINGVGANIYGSKDKKSDKDKDNKHKRCHHDTGDDVMSERDDYTHSQRHSSDRKKSRKDITLQTPIVKTGTKDLQGLRLFPQKLCT